MAFTLRLCSWFLSRETWFIELKFFLLNLVQRRERTLNRNLVACTSLLSGFCKVTENVSVVKKSSTFVFNCAVRPRNNSSKLTCWHQTGKYNFFFSPLKESRLNIQATAFCWKTEHCSSKSLSEEDSKILSFLLSLSRFAPYKPMEVHIGPVAGWNLEDWWIQRLIFTDFWRLCYPVANLGRKRKGIFSCAILMHFLN